MACKYFLWRVSSQELFKIYGTKNHYEPAQTDERYIWRGDDIVEARRVAKIANRKTQDIPLEFPSE